MNARIERAVTAAVVFISCAFVFQQLQPDLLFTDSTPTGGDMGAHVWGPAFLRDELLPRLRLSGWTPDWYSGFPAFHFYMVLPALAIVLLDIGLHPLISIPTVIGLGALAATFAITGERRRAMLTLLALCIIGPIVVGIPYNVAFKLVSVSGVVTFPLGAWALAHFGGLRFPGPAFVAVGSLAFAFDRSFNIYGGNIASTLAGEFAASMSLTLSLVAIGLVIHGTRTGEHRRTAAVFIALTGLTHLLPAFFVLAAVGVTLILRVLQRRWHAVPWLLVAGGLSAMLSAFWVLPFYLRTDYLNDMGWERIEIVHSPLVTRSILNPSEILSNYPPFPVLLILAVVGLVLSIVRRVELGVILAGTGAIMAAGFVWFPDGRLWNARILPFYYLCVGLLAAIGVALAVQSLARARLAVRAGIAVASILAFVVPDVRNGWVWPEPGGEGYFGPASWYTIRVLATAALVMCILTELPRILALLTGLRWPVVAMAAIAVIIVTPARDIGSMSLSPSLFLWAAALFSSLVVLVFVGMTAARTVSRLQGTAAPPDPGPQEASPRILTDPDDVATSVLHASPIGALAVGLVVFGLALNSIGGIGTADDGTRQWSVAGLHITSADNSFIPGWASWNYSGLQAKPRVENGLGDVGQGGWDEYRHVQRTMLGVGDQVGCGRAMWEFAPELNRYGTTMAMMLLPMWTDGCIGSMEGLYFEATPTVPYHFMLQSDLSAPSRRVGESQNVGGPSRAMRDLPYGSFDIDVGVDRMHELGVRYYLAFSPQSISAARDHPELNEVTSSPPWVVFETEAPIVEALSVEPVVIDGVRNHQDQWLDVGIEWFTGDVGVDRVRPASSGPDSWRRIDAEGIVSRFDAPDTQLAGSIGIEDAAMEDLLATTPVVDPPTVSGIEVTTDRIRFNVDRIGTPVLVRTSYFPAWKVDGAEGPFRVAPNAMVVVPTEQTVELRYGRTGVDWAGILLTVAGLLGLIGLGRLPSLGRPSQLASSVDDPSATAIEAGPITTPTPEMVVVGAGDPQPPPVPVASPKIDSGLTPPPVPEAADEDA